MAFNRPQQQGGPGMPGGAPPEQIMVQDMMESCVFKTGVSGVVGFGFGGLLSLFMQAGVWQNTDEMMKLKLKDQIKATYRDMKKRTMETGKNLAVVGAVFAGTECVIESYRGKNDIYNGVAAGCITGGALAAQAGPQAVVAGCVGFAAFSAAIDYVTKEYFN